MLIVDGLDTGTWVGVVEINRLDGVIVFVGVGANRSGEKLAVRMLDGVNVHLGGMHNGSSVSWDLLQLFCKDICVRVP